LRKRKPDKLDIILSFIFLMKFLQERLLWQDFDIFKSKPFYEVTFQRLKKIIMNHSDPFLGFLFIAIGGLASASFYLPLKYVKKWSWESGWAIYSVVALLIGPWILAMLTIPNLFGIISEVSSASIFWPVLFGVGWGIGGLTWGLSIRFLGIGLGNAFPLGLTSAFSTIIGPFVPILIDPAKRPEGMGSAISVKAHEIFSGTSGSLTLLAVAISLVGIGFCGYAASLKDKDKKSEGNAESGKDFNLKKGMIVAVIAGVMSACFAFGEYAGNEMTSLTASQNPGSIWSYNPVYAVLLIGGFLFNFSYSIYLNFKNKTLKDYSSKESPVMRNFILAGVAGLVWFSQFVFKGIGTTKIPENVSFITWGLLFTFVIVFSNVIGIIGKEWKGVKSKTMMVLLTGMGLLIGSAILSGIASTFK